MSSPNTPLDALLRLSHELGRRDQPLSILGEGNTSVKLGADTFRVKASGTNLATLKPEDTVECKSSVLLSLLDKTNLTDAEVDRTLMESRVAADGKKPSVEALFHAYFLSLPGIEFVGHTHAPAVNGILCSPRAREFATKRVFPDEIVCCDVASVFVPYTDPGLRLAQAVREQTQKFMDEHGRPPRVVLLENHGIITLGRTVEAVLGAMLMAEKAATIWVNAGGLGGPTFLSPENIQRISGRPDEEVRRRVLKM
ncbi:MAG TPA: class II aldolase/adducin family protein [Verrucomicrobiae bacterium]|nr:class II aldolase/adducin family protein [Verrucomicrobiae bacterium]